MTPSSIIFHITTRAAWDAARAAGSYQPASLAAEGFVHASTAAQVVDTANKYVRGRADLILLCIDPARLTAELRYGAPMLGAPDDPRADQRFPHIYGALDLDAVVETLAFPCDADGRFTLPAALRAG